MNYNKAKESYNLTKRQRLQKKRLLSQMQNEIKELELEIKNSKSKNTKIMFFRSLKIFLRFNQMIAPYVVTIGLLMGFINLLRKTPEIVENKPKIENGLDNNTKYEQKVLNNDTTVKKISYISKWERKDSFYERQIKDYSTDNINDLDKILNMKEIESLETIFGDAIAIKNEIKKYLNDDEINENASLQVTLYNENDNFIVIKNNIDNDMLYVVLCVLLSILFNLKIYMYRRNIGQIKFTNQIKNIKKEYPIIDRQELIKKLQIKQDNYNRLTR